MAKKRSGKTGNNDNREAITESEGSEQPKQFPVVGIGASAGGLEALEAFFTALPADPGMAFLVIQHTKPDHKSYLPDLLSRYTPLPVAVAQDQVMIEPNHVYVIPADSYAAVFHAHIQLIKPTKDSHLKLPIDYIFRSLAEDLKENAIAIILSGTGTDGTLGVKEIKGEGGMIMAQLPSSAQYDSMPRSAIESDMVDYIMPPEQMPAELIRYVETLLKNRDTFALVINQQESALMQKVFVLLRTRTGHDFSGYKKKTMTRRIQRRMTINRIESLAEYVDYLQESNDELDILFSELLVGVSAFFRDTEAFSVLEAKVIPQLFENKRVTGLIRVWVVGCSTGEEAYSLAILLHEYMDTLTESFKVQIFATDIDPTRIQQARAGRYPLNIESEVSPRRLARFFTKEGNHYVLRSQIREMIIFATQSVIKDPPFSRIDLLSCRNLLIYLEADLQKKLIPVFHHVLNVDSYLFLGNSESLGEYSHLFRPIDRKWKILQCIKADYGEGAVQFPYPSRIQRGERDIAIKPTEQPDIGKVIERLLLENYTDPCAIINEHGIIVYLHNRTDKYLEPVVGEMSSNILRMAREGLRLPLAAALRRVRMSEQHVVYKNIQVKKNGDTHTINLYVDIVKKPVSLQGFFVIAFEDVIAPSIVNSNELGTDINRESSQRITDLEQELGSTREYLQAVVEELEVSNEELKSVNEELHAANEELQSSNEELETATEELQSVNEELATTNNELENKLTALTDSNNDLSELLINIEVGIIFLDRKLLVRRFTPSATHFISLINTDIGRPLSDLVPKLRHTRLIEDAQQVLDTLIPIKVEIQAENGSWYWIITRPHRTTADAIAGVVITFIDVTERVSVQEASRQRVQTTHDQELAEMPFHKANQIVDALFEWNQMLIQVSDEQGLIETMCDTLIAIGDYRMVWVGLTANGKDKRLHAVAYAGFEDGYLSGLDGGQENEGPDQVALRTGEPAISQDIDSDPTFGKRRAAALARGYISTAALPLKDELAKVIGVLNIYSSHKNAFGEVEIGLLQKMADSLARGITQRRDNGV